MSIRCASAILLAAKNAAFELSFTWMTCLAILYIATKLKDAPVAPGPALLRTLYANLGKSTVDKWTMTDIFGGSESFMQFRSGLVNLPMQIVQDNNKQTKGILKCLSPLGAVDEALKIPLQGYGRAEDDHVDLTTVIIANSGLPPAQEHPGSQPSSIALLRWLGVAWILDGWAAVAALHKCNVLAESMKPDHWDLISAVTTRVLEDMKLAMISICFVVPPERMGNRADSLGSELVWNLEMRK
ncbi:MAG: hypothetical protein Q9180_003175 [Flavoplaca navasiana]